MEKARRAVDEVSLKDWKNFPEEDLAHSLLLIIRQFIRVKLGIKGGEGGIHSVSQASQWAGVLLVNCCLCVIDYISGRKSNFT